MRKSFLMAPVIMALCAATSIAHADYRDEKVRAGVGVSLGVPGGAAIGLVILPKLDWLRVEADVAYNYLSIGGRASVQLDPMAEIMIRHHGYYADGTDRITKSHLPIGVYADINGGIFPTSSIPGHTDLPKVGYDYLNLYAALRLGSPTSFHWYFAAGPTYMHATTQDFQKVVGTTEPGLVLGSPTAKGWITPTGMTGFQWLF